MNLDFGAVETLRKVLKKIECNEELDFQEQWVGVCPILHPYKKRGS